MVELSGTPTHGRLDELRAYAEKGPSVSRATCGWAADRIDELQDLLATALGDRLEPPLEAATPHWCRCVFDVTGAHGSLRGYAGDFARRVTELALKCDSENLGLLGRAFPTAVAAVLLWRVDPDEAVRRAETWT